MATLYDFSAKTTSGETKALSDYAGSALLIVNTASQCGFTPQFKGLEALFRTYNSQGFAVLGFPCNQFGAQEPGDAAAIAGFCTRTYDVTFPMFDKIEVNGPATHPLYRFLKMEAKGFLGSEQIKWNFTKFLVSRTGKIVARYAPTTSPESIAKDIEKLL